MVLLAAAAVGPLKTLNPSSRGRRLHSPAIRLPHPLPRVGRLRCSAEYREASAPRPAAPTTTTTTTRPAEIPWSRELCNSVRLIGTVGTEVELRQLPSGGAVARGRLAVWKSATETTWVTLAFWDDLAVVASEHVKKGDRIFVSGRLVSDTVDEGPEKRQVVVQEFNFIESFQPVQLYEPEAGQDTLGGKRGNYAGSTAGSTEDSRGHLDSSSRSTEQLWQAFFANPLDWWDNRTNKKNPRYPDFKHKHTGEALWVDGRNNPNWVISQLAILDSRMGSIQGSERKPVAFMYADDFMTPDTDTKAHLESCGRRGHRLQAAGSRHLPTRDGGGAQQQQPPARPWPVSEIPKSRIYSSIHASDRTHCSQVTADTAHKSLSNNRNATMVGSSRSPPVASNFNHADSEMFQPTERKGRLNGSKPQGTLGNSGMGSVLVPVKATQLKLGNDVTHTKGIPEPAGGVSSAIVGTDAPCPKKVSQLKDISEQTNIEKLGCSSAKLGDHTDSQIPVKVPQIHLVTDITLQMVTGKPASAVTSASHGTSVPVSRQVPWVKLVKDVTPQVFTSRLGSAAVKVDYRTAVAIPQKLSQLRLVKDIAPHTAIQKPATIAEKAIQQKKRKANNGTDESPVARHKPNISDMPPSLFSGSSESSTPCHFSKAMLVDNLRSLGKLYLPDEMPGTLTTLTKNDDMHLTRTELMGNLRFLAKNQNFSNVTVNDGN
uniref:Uncharacterized protein n=1 Tax=Leersia perrieri TaxID=77586 RepID=A0A0D9VWL4_9ORYZ